MCCPLSRCVTKDLATQPSGTATCFTTHRNKACDWSGTFSAAGWGAYVEGCLNLSRSQSETIWIYLECVLAGQEKLVSQILWILAVFRPCVGPLVPGTSTTSSNGACDKCGRASGECLASRFCCLCAVARGQRMGFAFQSWPGDEIGDVTCQMIFYDNEESRMELSPVWRVLDMHCACYCAVHTLEPCFAGAPGAQRLMPCTIIAFPFRSPNQFKRKWRHQKVVLAFACL